MLETIQVDALFDRNKTIASSLFDGCTYPWEALERISSYILALGPTLPSEEFDHPKEDVWIAKSALVYPSVWLEGPCIIDQGAQLRHNAFVRGSVIVGKEAVVGNSTELKNVVLFDRVQVPHFNYVGDSILGCGAHLGAGAVTSNVKSDKSLVCVKTGSENLETNRKKVGAMVGDFAEVGCNSVLCPGTVIGRHSIVYPLSRVRGLVPEASIYKEAGNIAVRRMNR